MFQARTVELFAGQFPEEKPIVIVLNPGHGGKASGATRTWSKVQYIEKDMNLAIALFCKAELEKYAGVKVYLTREADVDVTLEDRVRYAKRMKADLFVSLHNNGNEKSSIRGTSVIYPNKNLNPSISKKGKDVAEKIHKELLALGIPNRGIYYRNSENVLSVNVLFAPVGVQATWTRVEQENLSDKPEQTTDMAQRVVLTWEAVCGADGYRIAKRENPGEALSVVAEISGQAVTTWSEDLPGDRENYPQYEVCSCVWVDGVMQCSSYVTAVENFVDNEEMTEQNPDLEENIQIAQNE